MIWQHCYRLTWPNAEAAVGSVARPGRQTLGSGELSSVACRSLTVALRAATAQLCACVVGFLPKGGCLGKHEAPQPRLLLRLAEPTLWLDGAGRASLRIASLRQHHESGSRRATRGCTL